MMIRTTFRGLERRGRGRGGQGSRTKRLGRSVCVVAACAAGLTACGPGDDAVVVISESRAWTESDEAVRTDLTTAQRFQIEEARSGAPDNPFRWATPDGWTPAESSRMRAVNFTFGPEGEGECYLTALPGGGGGLVANVNRWRAQMGLDDLDEEAIAALPSRMLLGSPATFVDFEGSFTPMGAAEPLPGYRLLGLIQEHSGFMFFVKMTGPADLVAANESAFEEFCSSLSIGSSRGG